MEEAIGPTPDSDRVIALIDLDCFYAQVEQVRLGYPNTLPLAVQQWNGIIAVNYAARKFGVTRSDSAETATKKCPDILLVHVELIGESKTEEEELEEAKNYRPKAKSALSKVSLERYRNASREIFAILQSEVATLEKASIDEAFCDLTDPVQAIINSKEHPIFQAGEGTIVNWAGKVLPNAAEGDTQLNAEVHVDQLCLSDLKLLIGSLLVDDIRNKIKDQLGYTCSSGIAHNKLLAKMIASTNKPDGQTILRVSAVEKYLSTADIRDMWCLGGKMGRTLQSIAISTPLELQALSKEKLTRLFGEKHSNYIYYACRGIDDRPVNTRLVVSSIMAAKSFSPIDNMKDLQVVITLLCTDIIPRMKIDQDQHNRIPGTLTVGFKCTTQRAKSISAPMITSRLSQPALASTINKILSNPNNQLFPCVRLYIQASNFVDMHKQSKIATFFKAPEAGPPPAFPQPPKSVYYPPRPAPVHQKELTTHLELRKEEKASTTEDLACSKPTEELIVPSSGLLSDTNETSDPEGTYYLCPVCSSLVLKVNHQTHFDFHVAQKLQQEINKLPRNEESPPQKRPPLAFHPPAPKRRKQAKQKSISDFF